MSGAESPGAGPRLVLATRNQGKLRELRELLRGKVPGLDVDTQVIDAETAGAPDVVEDGVTFEENSLKKARAVSAHTGLVAVADDSGLAVEVLGGAPGIFSARWAGRHGDDEDGGGGWWSEDTSTMMTTTTSNLPNTAQFFSQIADLRHTKRFHSCFISTSSTVIVSTEKIPS